MFFVHRLPQGLSPCLIARRRCSSIRSLAVFPWSTQVVHRFVSLGPGAMECGVGSWDEEERRVSTDRHKNRPDLLIASVTDAAPIRSLAVSPCSA